MGFAWPYLAPGRCRRASDGVSPWLRWLAWLLSGSREGPRLLVFCPALLALWSSAEEGQPGEVGQPGDGEPVDERGAGGGGKWSADLTEPRKRSTAGSPASRHRRHHHCDSATPATQAAMGGPGRSRVALPRQPGLGDRC